MAQRKKSNSSVASHTPITEALRWCVEDSLMFADGRSPFQATIGDSAGAAVTVVTGENASGKSLLVRQLAAVLRQRYDTHVVTLSIRERTGSGSSEMGGMQRVFMYGDEEKHSTGAVSIRTLATSFNNLTSDRHARTALVLDEPEMGLSDGYAHALGTYVAEQAHSTPSQCAGVVLVTHSRALVRGLRAHSEPAFVHCHARSSESDVGAPDSLDSWLAIEETRSVADLLALPDIGLNRFRSMHAMIDA